MKTTKKILVVDLEATCWEQDGEYQRKHSEIIEIGICVLDIETGVISSNKGILIKPQFSEVSEFCTKLTSITKEMLDKDGISLEEACEILNREYNSKEYTWASYGYYDIDFLKEQCNRFNVAYPMSSDHINIKVLLSRKLNMKKGMGMKRALQYLNMPLIGTHHRGVDDANNCAKILYWILKD